MTLPPVKNKLEQWKVYRKDGHVDSTWVNAEGAQKQAKKIGGTIKQTETLDLKVVSNPHIGMNLMY